MFIPIEDIGNTFSQLLDKYPVTPYLDSRESFMKWVHFIHNKINVALDQPELTMEEALVNIMTITNQLLLKVHRNTIVERK